MELIFKVCEINSATMIHKLKQTLIMKKKIKEAIKKYNLIEEFKRHDDIVEKYKCNDLCENTDEAYQNGFWDEAGKLSDIHQDIIYYAFQDLLWKELKLKLK